MARPIEPPPTPWTFPDVDGASDEGIVCLGGDLEPGTILAAYRRGLFPMPVPVQRRVLGRRAERVLGWWSPDPRGVIPIEGLRVSRSLRRSSTAFEVRVDTAFVEVMRACGDPRRPHGWITEEFVAAYAELHRLGWAHSVETWQDERLVGGLYGLSIGGLFAGESMFHRVTDASKVALVALVSRLAAGGAAMLDVQWCTDHLASLGAVEVARADYLARLADALQRPPIAWTAPPPAGSRPAEPALEGPVPTEGPT